MGPCPLAKANPYPGSTESFIGGAVAHGGHDGTTLSPKRRNLAENGLNEARLTRSVGPDESRTPLAREFHVGYGEEALAGITDLKVARL